MSVVSYLNVKNVFVQNNVEENDLAKVISMRIIKWAQDASQLHVFPSWEFVIMQRQFALIMLNNNLLLLQMVYPEY